MTPIDYQTERQLRGTQESVAGQLGIHTLTISKRERGAPDAPITREAWLALLSLPKKRKRRSGTPNVAVRQNGKKGGRPKGAKDSKPRTRSKSP